MNNEQCLSKVSMELLFENLATAVLVVEDNGLIVCTNPAAESLLSSSASRIEGQRVDIFFSGSGDFLGRIKQSFQNDYVFSNREVDLIIPSILKAVKVDCSFTPLINTPYVLIELNQVDQKLKIAKEENIVAQQSVLKVLVRGLAHEVKNPLGGIRGAAQLLERELPTSQLKEYTEVIIGETDRLQKLVDDMLGPNRPLKKELMNIHVVLERVRQLVKAESSKELDIIRDYDPSLPEFFGDQNQLIQALLNIVRNANQALVGKGKIVLRSRSERQVTIGQKYHRYVLKIDIIDDGPGIDPDFIEKIFFPMVTSRIEGTGLGLSIAQTLIAQHEGLIECASKPGETVFTVLLPLVNNKKNR